MTPPIGVKSDISEAQLFKKLNRADTGQAKYHLHFCSNRGCRRIYEDACLRAERNVNCHACQGRAQTEPLWVSSRNPVACCANNVRQLMRRDERLRYDLAGPGPWFQCRTCARSSGWPTGIPETSNPSICSNH